MTATQQGIITLLKSAITGKALPLPADFDLEQDLALLKKQSLQALAYQGAYNCGVDPQSEPMKQLFFSYYKLLIYHENQMKALSRLFEEFENQKIDYMPLKGVNLKKLYPKAEMRTMGDADILIRQEQYPQITKILERLGYSLTNVDEQVYTWDSPQLHLEVHQYIVQPLSRYHAYYGTGWRLARPGEGHRYHMSHEDEFVFLFAHFARHYRIGGMGCRHVLDLYVHKRTYPDMNESYLEQELEKLNLRQFYHNMNRVLAVWFDNQKPDAVTELITEYIFSGGTFGSGKNRKYYFEVMGIIKDQSVENAKIKMYIQTAFPPLSYVRRSYPILYKMPYLLPVIWVVRLVEKLFHPEKIRNKVAFLESVKEEDVEFRRKTLEVMGIEFDTKEDVR